MPIPKPSSNSKDKDAFISKCMSDSVMLREFKDQRQRAGVCYSQWKSAHKRKKSKGSTESPTWEEISEESVIYLDYD